MLANIESQHGLVMAEKVMLALVDVGMHRDSAHEALRLASMKALNDGCNLLETCLSDPQIMELMSEAELVELFDPRGHLGVSGEIVDATINRAESVLSK